MIKTNGLQLKAAGIKRGSSECWDVLDHFIQQLQEATRSSGQFHLLLQAICEGLEADAAFLYCFADENLEIVGGRALDADWCRSLAERLLRNATSGTPHLLCASPAEMSGVAAPLPT